MRAFFDTSALAKRYLLEPGRDKVEAVLKDASEAAVSLICPPELVSALRRLWRQSALSDDDYGRVKTAFFADIEDLTIRAISISVVEKAISLIEALSLKTLDAIQVACALDWRADLFVSSDRRQLSAASKSGLQVLAV